MNPAKEFAIDIIKRLRDAGYEGLLVGGAVRDEQLGRSPKDYDVVTNCLPDRLVEIFPDADRIGAAFGVVLVKQSGMSVEVATYRSDGVYSDGRRPDSVKFQDTAESDVSRRDFSINGLLFDPFSGQLIDYVGGLKDLSDGVIRAIGYPQARFREDHLRMLRAVRFAARFGFEIEPVTMGAIWELTPHIKTVSAERTRDEISRILTEGGAAKGVELLKDTGLLHYIIPEMIDLIGCSQPPEFHPEGDVWTHTLKVLGALDHSNPHSIEVALAALLHDIGKPATRTVDPNGRIRFNGHAEIGVAMTREILNRLKFPNAVIDQVTDMVAVHMRFHAASDMKQSTLKRLVRVSNFSDYLELHRLDTLGGSGDLTQYNYIQARLDQWSVEGTHALRPALLINGHGLQAAGYVPGPAFKVILSSLETAQLDGRVNNLDEAWDFVKTNFPIYHDHL